MRWGLFSFSRLPDASADARILFAANVSYQKQTPRSATPNRAVPSADELGACQYVFRQGIIGPLGRLHNAAHNEPHALAINLPNRSSSDPSIKFVSYQSGDGFFFLHFSLAGIVDQSAAYPRPVRRSTTTAPSQRCLKLLQACGRAHLITLRNGTTGFVLTATAASISVIRRSSSLASRHWRIAARIVASLLASATATSPRTACTRGAHSI